MPDYKFVNLINYKSTTAKAADFKGKLLIMYFWSTNCLSCVASFPKLVKLQDQFAGSVQFILFNAYESEPVVRNIFDKRKRLGGVDVDIPTVCGDTVLSKYFPRQGVPHVIWIDKEGYVRSKTSGPLLTASNIISMLNNPFTELPQAGTEEPSVTINYKNPLFLKGNAGNGDGVVHYSILSKYVENVRDGTASMKGSKKTGQYNRITVVNLHVQDLYGFAFSNRLSDYGTLWELPHSRVIFEGIDSIDYVWAMPKDGIMLKKNIYTYDLLTDSGSMQETQLKMQEDLKRFFGYEARWEKRKIKCRILSMVDTLSHSKPSGKNVYQTIDQTKFYVDGGYSMNRLMWNLEGLYGNSPVPILDETGFHGSPGGILLDVDASNPDALDKALRSVGMSFKEEYREIDVVIVSKPRNSHASDLAYFPPYK
jgi:thiol-disulfide isomerase/thioredoxin